MRPGWLDTLRARGYLLIGGVPLDADNHSLRAFGAELGQPSLRALAQRAGLVEPGGVQRVEALPTTPLDQYGKPLLSAASAAFALHTDESFCEVPARWVLLHCWRPAASSGDTLLADAQDVFDRADRVTQIALQQLRLPFPFGDAVTIDAARRVRFNRTECAAAAQAQGRELSPVQALWLERFQALFQPSVTRLQLTAGDLLIVDNWRLLHGRDAFAADSGRLLKRLRID